MAPIQLRHSTAAMIPWLLLGLFPLSSLCFDTTFNAGNRTCYDPSGSAITPEVERDQWVICNPSASISHCCKHADYCMSNGVCFDAGAHNAMSIQGCTDPGWGGTCQKFCGQIATLSPCNDDFSLFACSGGCATKNFSLEVGQIMPVGHFDVTTSPPSSPTQTNSGSTQPPSKSDTASSGSAQDNNKSLAIGLGVGIPLGLAAIAATVFLGCQMRRLRRTREDAFQVMAPSSPEKDFGTASNIRRGGYPPHELGISSVTHELPGSEGQVSSPVYTKGSPVYTKGSPSPLSGVS